jgi:hypothetical protein
LPHALLLCLAPWEIPPTALAKSLYHRLRLMLWTNTGPAGSVAYAVDYVLVAEFTTWKGWFDSRHDREPKLVLAEETLRCLQIRSLMCR